MSKLSQYSILPSTYITIPTLKPPRNCYNQGTCFNFPPKWTISDFHSMSFFPGRVSAHLLKTTGISFPISFNNNGIQLFFQRLQTQDGPKSLHHEFQDHPRAWIPSLGIRIPSLIKHEKMLNTAYYLLFSVSGVSDFATPWTRAHQAFLSKRYPEVCSNSCPLSR